MSNNVQPRSASCNRIKITELCEKYFKKRPPGVTYFRISFLKIMVDTIIGRVSIMTAIPNAYFISSREKSRETNAEKT